MKRLIKWGLIIGGSVLILILAALFILPFFVDMQQYKPILEERASAELGRPVSINGDIRLSLLPPAGIAITDLNIGNPEGFEEKEFVSIGHFEAGIKLLPLLSRNVQIDRFVIEKPKILLVTQKNGRSNWQMPEKSTPEEKPEERTDETQTGFNLPLEYIRVDEILLKDGLVRIIDHTKTGSTEISNISVKIEAVQFDRPVELSFMAEYNKIPIALNGRVGPVGRNFGADDVPVDFTVRAMDEAKITVNGKLRRLADKPAFDLTFRSDPFSPKEMLSAIDLKDRVQTMDPQALTKMAFSFTLSGDSEAMTISDGNIVLDDSALAFGAVIQNTKKPALTFEATLDQLDANRYFPPETKSEKAAEQPKADASEPPDFSVLRALSLKGDLKAGEINVHQVPIRRLVLRITGNDGVFRIEPLSFQLYEGRIDAQALFNVATDKPKTEIALTAENIQANPLVVAFLEKDILEGTLKANVDLQARGIDPNAVKTSLSGSTDLLFRDGAVKGINLTDMVRNIKTAFARNASEPSGEAQPRTDFTELHLPIQFENGIARTSSARLVSPLVRAEVEGSADLMNERLDFRITPNFVATISGQGDTRERSGIKVPILVTGSFSSPKFAPDMEGIVKKQLEQRLPIPKKLKESLSGGETGNEKPGSGSVEDAAKGLLESLPFGK
ncbi:MAG: AsmA family protein [Desulfobacterales bacterium]